MARPAVMARVLSRRTVCLLACVRFAGGTDVVYSVSAVADPVPILSQRQGKSDWAQLFNPTYVEPSAATANRSGLLVRSQNCTRSTGAHSCGPTCKGTGQQASWLTWAELEEDTGVANATPQVKNFVGAQQAVFGPFDCENKTSPPADCVDSFGTEDPRVSFDPESKTYVLLYNAWNGKAAKLSIATTSDPTKRDGWSRHGELFPNAVIGSYKSGSLVLRDSGPHFVIWGCAHELRITPSVGRSLTQFNYSASETLLTTRRAPFWDTGFVESAMPPLKLSTGDLLFFYDSVGSWSNLHGFQPGWVVLSGADPRQYTLPWEVGDVPWPCNTPRVSNLGGGYAISGDPSTGADRFRVYFGGADAVVGAAVVTVTASSATAAFTCVKDAAGLGQCFPVSPARAPPPQYPSFVACQVACEPSETVPTPAPAPPTPVPPTPPSPSPSPSPPSPLDCFTAEPDAAKNPNVCFGAYQVKLDTDTAEECAQKCLADVQCLQFVKATPSYGDPHACRLSHTCSAPTSYLAGFDGYLRNKTRAGC